MQDDNHRISLQTLSQDEEVLVKDILLQLPLSRQGLRKPSPTLWRLIMVTGDTLFVFLAFICAITYAPALNRIFHLIWYSQMPWGTQFTWVCIAFLSWNMAVVFTQVQDLAIAVNPFKSPLSMFFSLLTTCVLLVIFTSYFFSSKGSFLYNDLPFCYFVIATPVMCTWRFLLAECMNLPRFCRKAIIIGINPATHTLLQEIAQAKRPGISILAGISNTLVQKNLLNLPIYTGCEALRYFAEHNIIDTIIMAIDYKENPELFQEALDAAQRGVAVIPVTTIYENVSGKVPVKFIGDQWYTTLPSEQSVPPAYLFWHSALDILFGLCGTLLLVVIFPVLALLISLDSHGPIFYSQERLGLKGKPFRIYKFRSMHVDAEKAGKAQWAKSNDSRVTRVGHFMRSTHLDEIPQVWNILRGDMSLVGPRPERAEFVSSLEKNIPFYHYRLSVKPGLTGWAQVKYVYSNTDNDALVKLQYDLYYIKHQSLMLDIFIILKTVIEIVFMRGV